VADKIPKIREIVDKESLFSLTMVNKLDLPENAYSSLVDTCFIESKEIMMFFLMNN
jgi:hypothetical protein